MPALLRCALAALAAIAWAPTTAVAQAGSQTTSFASPPSSSAPPTGSTACNNSPALCGRSYSNITHMGAHNSAFLRDRSTGNSLAGNQFFNATVALNAGLRFLQIQVHLSNGNLQLCHTSCALLDAGPLETWLAAIDNWLAQNPNEVITLLIVNAGSAPASQFASVMQSTGIAARAFNATTTGPLATWPTLQSMIDSGSRVVVFITNLPYTASTPYLLPEFDFVFETEFRVTELNGFNCTLDRPSRAAPASAALANNYLSLVNHFKYQSLTAGIMIPDVDRIDTVNSPATTTEGNLGRHLQTCNSEWARQPNFVLVDFWDRSNPIQAVDSMNGLTSTTGRRSATSSNNSAAAALSHPCHGLAAMVAVAFSILLT